MSKIKVIKNGQVTAVDFKTDLTKGNLLFEICRLFELDNIFIDVFGVSSRSENFVEKLLKSNASMMISQIDESCSFSIKTEIKSIPMILEVLDHIHFDEINIWDCYTDWENYLKIKNMKMPFFTVKPLNVKNDSKFYLNYNPLEGQKVEIICDIDYYTQDIADKIQSLIR